MLETGLYRDLSEQTKRDLAQYGSRSVPEGADTAVWLATSADVDGVTGRFFEQDAEKPCDLCDEEVEEHLWQACEQLVGRLARRI